MSDNGWVSAHLYYQGDLDPLIVGVVAPVIEDLAKRGALRRFFFLRYWDGGPHLRFRVLPAAPTQDRDVRTIVLERAEAYLRDHPSLDLLTEETYRRSVENLGRWEGIVPSSIRQRNNSVQFMAYQRETARYGAGPEIEATERHFDEASRLALRLLLAGLEAGPRDTAALALILLSWYVAADEQTPASVMRMDTWRNLLLASGADAEASVAELYEAQQDRVVAIARRMRTLASTADCSSNSDTFGSWVRSLTNLRRVHAAAGGLATSTTPDPAQTSTTLADFRTPWSVIDICAHLMCNRMGVRLESEGILRYLASRAVVELSGEEE